MLEALILQYTAAYSLPPHLLDAMIAVESAGRVTAVRMNDGPGGTSRGLLQVQCPAARQVGFKGKCRDLLDPNTNLQVGAAYLKYQLKRYRGNYARAITAYNAGRSSAHGGSAYLAKVINKYFELRTKTTCSDLSCPAPRPSPSRSPSPPPSQESQEYFDPFRMIK